MGTPLTIAATTWPTARSEDGESCGNHPGAVDSLTGAARLWNTPHGMSNRDSRGKVGGCGGGQFALQANHWETPRASTGGLREYDGKRGVGVNTQAAHWQTPATDSFRSRGGERKEEMGLDQEARAFTSLPDPATPDGLTSCEYDQTSLQPCPSPPTRRLNPRFVEFLMGLPIGWTEL
jgi:hypothetical protein